MVNFSKLPCRASSSINFPVVSRPACPSAGAPTQPSRPAGERCAVAGSRARWPPCWGEAPRPNRSPAIRCVRAFWRPLPVSACRSRSAQARCARLPAAAERKRKRVFRATAEPMTSSPLRVLEIRIAALSADGSSRRARRMSKASTVQAGSTPASHSCTRSSWRKSAATMDQPVSPIGAETDASERNHSLSFDQRRRPETLRTAMATAFFWPTSTTRRFPRVTPV